MFCVFISVGDGAHYARRKCIRKRSIERNAKTRSLYEIIFCFLIFMGAYFYYQHFLLQIIFIFIADGKILLEPFN
jgi:hypothetical protein